MNMIHSNILQNPTLSGRLKPTAPYAVRCLLGNLSKVNVQIPWSSMISCMDPPSRPWKFAKTRRPSASKGSNKTSPGEVKRQNCKLGQRDLVGLRCSLLELILQFLKTSKYHQMISSISEKKNHIYIYINVWISQKINNSSLLGRNPYLCSTSNQPLLNSHLIPPQTKAASPARPWIKAHASSSPTFWREG